MTQQLILVKYVMQHPEETSYNS